MAPRLCSAAERQNAAQFVGNYVSPSGTTMQVTASNQCDLNVITTNPAGKQSRVDFSGGAGKNVTKNAALGVVTDTWNSAVTPLKYAEKFSVQFAGAPSISGTQKLELDVSGKQLKVTANLLALDEDGRRLPLIGEALTNALFTRE